MNGARALAVGGFVAGVLGTLGGFLTPIMGTLGPLLLGAANVVMLGTNVAVALRRQPRDEVSSAETRSALVQTGWALDALASEISRARRKFPRNRNLLPALVEEVGELAQALLQGKNPAEIRKEALQVACVAVRIVEEGCPEFDNLSAEERQP